MKRLAALLVAGLTGAALAAGPVQNPVLSHSENGPALTHFSSRDAKIYGVAHVLGKAGAPLRVAWVADRVNADVKPGYVIATLDKTLVLTSGGLKSNVFRFSLSRPTAGWPVGQYHVAFFVAAGPGQPSPAQPTATLPFSISK